MTISKEQAQMLAELARATRPTGARHWDTAGIVAAIKQVADRQLAEVVMAFIKGAADRDCETPAGVVASPRYWRESAAVRTYTPHIVEPANRCGICSKDRRRCQSERVADDDHQFEAPGPKPSTDVPRVVAALKSELVPTAAPPEPRPLAERVAALPRDEPLETLRESLAHEPEAVEA